MIFENIFEMSNNVSAEANNNTRNVISNYSRFKR